MACSRIFLVGLCASTTLASPWNKPSGKSKRKASPGGGSGWGDSNSGHPAYSHGGSWGSSSDGWGESTTSGGDWDYGTTSTYGAATVIETPVFTVYQSGPTAYGSASTVTLSASATTEYSTVFLTGSGSVSILPASTITAYTSVGYKQSTATLTVTATESASACFFYGGITPSPTTVFLTISKQGWNSTTTQQKVSTATATETEYETIYDEETMTLTSVVTAPGKNAPRDSPR